MGYTPRYVFPSLNVCHYLRTEALTEITIGTRSRAPLGNKTTNAKATVRRPGSVRIGAKDGEQSRLHPNSAQSIKQRSVDILPGKLKVKSDERDIDKNEEEPEYAPPRPEPLPYVSDVLPETELTFEGLKPENMFRGFYQHFHGSNEDAENGGNESSLAKEMATALRKAMEANDGEMGELNWGLLDTPGTTCSNKEPQSALHHPDKTLLSHAKSHRRVPSVFASKSAASKLGMQTGQPGSLNSKMPVKTLRKPWNGPNWSHKSTRSVDGAIAAKERCAIGEMASRNTIGYHQGRSTSSMVHSRGQNATTRPGQRGGEKPTAASIEHTESGAASNSQREPGSAILSIFDPIDEDDGLPLISCITDINLLDDGIDDEFQLKLDI